MTPTEELTKQLCNICDEPMSVDRHGHRYCALCRKQDQDRYKKIEEAAGNGD